MAVLKVGGEWIRNRRRDMGTVYLLMTHVIAINPSTSSPGLKNRVWSILLTQKKCMEVRHR